MAQSGVFARCEYCFAPKEHPGQCGKCGYAPGLCDQPGWWLAPGSVLKGRYVVGKNLRSTDRQITYLAWDLQRQQTVDLVEYFPRDLMTRDVTRSDDAITIPGREEAALRGKQQFWQKAQLFYSCVSPIEKDLMMDLFLRNDTCYYVIKRQKPQE